MRITWSYEGRDVVIERDADELVIGRPKPGVAIDIDLSPDQRVSRPHARLWLEAGQWWIEDLGSAHGTHLGGDNIKGTGKQPLRGVESIRIGSTTLQVELPAEPAPDETGAAGTEVAGPVDLTVSLDAAAPAFSSSDAATDTTRRLALLYELPLQFGAETRLDALLQAVVSGLVEAIRDARRGALLVKDRATGQLLLKAHVPPGDPAVSLHLARRAMTERQGFVWRRDPDVTVLADEAHIQSGMYVPLMWKDEALGVVCVDNAEQHRAFTGEDLRLMVAVAQHAAMAVVHHQLQDELRRTATLMGRLLTNFSPKIRDQLLARARHGRLNLGGETSEVTILVMDIRGFTRLTSGMDAADVVDLLNEYFSALVEAVFHHEGTVDKFVGDSILAVFGSPEPDPRQHEHAVRTALAMQAAMQELSRARSARGQVVCHIGVGIHCGEVLHGFIGSKERMEFTVIGDAVNRAARYCDGAGPGEILVSDAMHQRVWNLFQLEAATIKTKHEGDFSAFRVKGTKGP